MALHPKFPKSPYAELLPDQRWFPAAEELRSTAYEKLLPPLVAKIRNEVSTWRAAGYAGASETSRALLNWWFETEHLVDHLFAASPVNLEDPVVLRNLSEPEGSLSRRPHSAIDSFSQPISYF